MLSSLKKWVQDVTVDLGPPPPRSSPYSSSFLPSPSMSRSTDNYFYSTTPFNEQHESRNSISSAVYISNPVSMDSVRSSGTSTILIPQPSVSPAALDLSHLNQEEQAHIANVLRRARAVEEQQSSLLPLTVSSIMSPTASISPSLSSSSTSGNSFSSDKLENYANQIQHEAEKTIIQQESTLTTIHQCQTCGREHRENSTICSSCQENESIDYKIENIITFISQQSPPIKQTLSPISVKSNDYEEEEDSIYDNIIPIDREQELKSDINPNHTEIDENEFFYEESSPYELALISNKIQEQSLPSYKIDEYIDDDDHNERDHVKELEKTIENLSRYFPSEQTQLNKIDNDSILEMEIESPSADELSSHPPTHPLSLSISIPIKDRRGSLSRSSGVRHNLTDLLIPAILESHQPIQSSSSTNNKRILAVNRHKRNLPSVPNFLSLNQVQLRRANSESRFTLPAVPSSIIISQQNLDDESDLLEIDLNDPFGSMNRKLTTSKLEYELKTSIENSQNLNTSSKNVSSKVKQLRDQTTNTSPISNLNSSIKLKKKISSRLKNTNESVSPPPVIPPITKLEKSTSTEITYPFPITKLILNPSRHGVSTDLGFRITGGHSISHCMEVTACIENINIHHRNYQILKNIVQEGDEVLELGGVSLRGKSALFVENLMNKIQNEFEIIVRCQSANTNPHSFLTADTNIQRRHSMDVLNLGLTQPTNNTVTKSKSTSIYSLHQKVITTTNNPKNEQKPPSPKMLTSNEESPNLFSHRHRASLLPNDPGLNSPSSKINIERQNSNESDESDSLSQYFRSSQSRTSSLMTTGGTSISHGRSQSIIPIASDITNASHRLHNFLKSNNIRRTRGSTSIERKSSLALASLKFLKKKTKSVDFPSKRKTGVNQLQENDYVGDIKIQIGHDSEREQLVVRIIQAKNLLPKDTNGFSDPFVKVYLLPGRDQENKRRIKHVSKTLNPVWNHAVIYGHIHREELQYKKLEFTVWDYDRFKANDFLGQVTIDLKKPNVIDDKPHWYRLQALRSREEITNRSSSPRLFKMVSVDSAGTSTSTISKNSANMQSRSSPQK